MLVVIWSLLGMTVAQTPWLANSGLLQAIFYVVAGLGWVLPAMPIVAWMSRPDVNLSRAADTASSSYRCIPPLAAVDPAACHCHYSLLTFPCEGRPAQKIQNNFQ